MKNYKNLLDTNRMVNHVAIVMDGNGRWAEKKSLSRLEGHRCGSEIIESIVESASSIGIKVISLYTFSTENWSRPKEEVDGLWKIMESFYETKINNIKKNGVKVRVSGRINNLPKSTKKAIIKFIEETKHNKKIILNFCLNYGGRQEIVDAVNKWVSQKKPNEKLTLNKMEKYLYTVGLPEVDLMIRTGGECRLSNFLLWQLSYSEFIFLKLLWPDFRPTHLYKAVYDYQMRHRRYGSL